jgi:RimJ/RimL family protein N-acetyltransferase
MMAPTLVVRRSALDDSPLVLSWRNDPAVRAVSNHQEPIDPAAHATWFADALASPGRLLLMGTVGDLAVGFIRFDRIAASRVRVSIFLDPHLNGLGLGRHLLAMGEAELHKTWPDVRHVDAEVMAGNLASLKLFAAAGYDGPAPLLSKALA